MHALPAQRAAAREHPSPRRGSIDEAVCQLADRGASAAEIASLVGRAEIRLVMTAHPTEARRRTTIDKQARIFRELRALDDELGRDEASARERILATVQELWGSDELRATSLSVKRCSLSRAQRPAWLRREPSAPT